MKQFLQSLLLLFLFLGGNCVLAQSSEGTHTSQEIKLETFLIRVTNGPESLTWFLEGTGLTNSDGVRVVELGPDAKATLFTRLETLRLDNRVTNFELNASQNRLIISMKDMSAQQVFTAIEAHLQHSSPK